MRTKTLIPTALIAVAAVAAPLVAAAPTGAAAVPVVSSTIRMDWTGSYPKGIGTVVVAAHVSGASKVTVTMVGKSVKAKASGKASARTWTGTFHTPRVTDYAAKPKPRTVRIKACNASGCTHATRTLYPPALPPGAPS